MAIASTVAATRLGTLLGQGRPANVALTGGFHWAFWVCGAIALLGVPAAAALRRRATAPASLDSAVHGDRSSVALEISLTDFPGGDGFRPRRGSQRA